MIKISVQLLFFWIFLFSFPEKLRAGPSEEFPVLYQGRFRPAEAYTYLWIYEIAHTQNLKNLGQTSALDLLWSLHLQGSMPYRHLPVFWIRSANDKSGLGLPLSPSRFSYQELTQALALHPEKEQTMASLARALKNFERLQGFFMPQEEAFQNHFNQLQKEFLPPAKIKQILEQEFPLPLRLKEAGSLFKCLPGHYQAGEWFSLHALKVQSYSPSSNRLQPVGNFTLFSDIHFETIRKAYLALEQAFKSIPSDLSLLEQRKKQLSSALQKAYEESLAGKVYQQAHGKQLFYPSLRQLKIEALYVRYPWMKGIIALYFLGACSWVIASSFTSKKGKAFALGILFLSFFFHTLLLGIRSYILERPPVTNMLETLVYVPWVTVCLCLVFPSFRRQPLALVSACLISALLLLIIEVADLNQHLNQVQAVLDSQFWLMVHVLLVVASYGIFILGAVLGHIYLGSFLMHKKETLSMNPLPPLILQTLYGGTALLLSGTILGGIWAAQSWGRFWDWDPKESWAFISLCFYLLFIHAYRFHRITSFGLAVGAVGGALVISFTWYGVNYLLGTGLHSYGFGEGGAYLYYLFLGIEGLFLSLVLSQKRIKKIATNLP